MILRILGTLIASLIVNLAHAQESSTAVTAPATSPAVSAAPPATFAPPAETKVLQKIVITGSYIRRTVDEGAPSPVTQIDASGKSAQATSQSAGGIMRDNAVISSGGGSNVSFHGQSSANNLVLLNGLRLPKPGGETSVDIDFIPSVAIERVEVLKDGASALYGSEALAGVVNIITKKEYDGSNVSIRHSRPEMGKGSESTVTATYGKTFGSGNLLASFQFRNNQPLLYNQTEYGITDVKAVGSLNSFPGNIKATNPSGGYITALDCPASQLVNGTCRYDYYKHGLPLASERNYYTGLVSTGWDLGSKLRLETTTLITHQETISTNTPIITRFENQVGGTDYTITGAEGTAAGWQPFLNKPLVGGTDYALYYSPDAELGNRRDEYTTNAGSMQVKLGQQGQRFDWDLAAGYSLSDTRDDNVAGNANKDILFSMLKAGTWNPFKPAGQEGDLSAAKIGIWNTNFSDVTNARLIGSGKMLDFGDRSIYAALGMEEQFQNYRFRVDPYSLQGLPLTGSGTNQDGRRDVFSTFLELSHNPIHALQIQLAGRFDKYSDFGTTVNPKIGAAYKVSEDFMVRSSFGTGFKAPDLRGLFQGDLSRPQRFRDEYVCKKHPTDKANCNNLFSTTSYGDPNLDPERGKHWNMGVQIRPKKNWQVSVDHWRAEGTNALNSVNISKLTKAQLDYGLTSINSLGVTIVRDPQDVIQSVRYPVRVNSGTYHTNGIDLEVKYKNQFNPMGTGLVNFNFRVDHSHTLSNGSQPYFFTPYEQQRDLNWKNITSMSFSKDKSLIDFRARTYSESEKDGFNVGNGTIPITTEYDVHYEYYGAWNGVITFGIRNIFDLKMYNSYNNGLTGFNLPASDTSLGRTFYAGYSQDF